MNELRRAMHLKEIEQKLKEISEKIENAETEEKRKELEVEFEMLKDLKAFIEA